MINSWPINRNVNLEAWQTFIKEAWPSHNQVMVKVEVIGQEMQDFVLPWGPLHCVWYLRPGALNQEEAREDRGGKRYDGICIIHLIICFWFIKWLCVFWRVGVFKLFSLKFEKIVYLYLIVPRVWTQSVLVQNWCRHKNWFWGQI